VNSHDPLVVKDLPVLRARLQALYPRATVERCEFRRYDNGDEGQTIMFSGPREDLIEYGLASPFKQTWDLLPSGQGELTGGGYTSDRGSHVVHHSYDGVPPMPGARQYPPKGVEKEVAHMLRRIAKSSRAKSKKES
jgi:hypothetical protein